MQPTDKDEIEQYLATKFAEPGYSGPSADDLYETQRETKLMAGLGRAGSTIGSGLAGVKSDTGFYDQMEAGASADYKSGMDRISGADAKKLAIAEYLQKKNQGDEAFAYQKEQDAEKNKIERAKLNQREVKTPGEKAQEYTAPDGTVRLGRYIDGKGLVTSPNDMPAPKQAGSGMAKDAELMVGEFARKNAGKAAIANSIDALMNNWDKMPEDQRVSQGRQLIKTLNSTEGADAVGAEESKRLGSKLEFVLSGNIFNDNSTQFGRDLKGFQQQAIDTSNNIKASIRANQGIADGLKSGQKIGDLMTDMKMPQEAPSDGTAMASPAQIVPMTPQDKAAYDWVRSNPESPKAEGIVKKLKAKGMVP